MRITSIYRLPYVDDPSENLTGLIERTRFTAIDRQLESLFSFLGDGIISGWELSVSTSNSKNVEISRGSGVISLVAAATTAPIIIKDLIPSAKNYIYARLLSSTTYTAEAEYLSSTSVFESSYYLCLGAAITDSQGNITISTENRKELGLINQIVSIISKHVHTGQPGEPSKIDLFNHVKGVLSAANIQDLDASKITTGVFDKNRISLSHNDLLDRGTLTHEELDSLVDKLQKINKILFGDVMSANLLQLMISMKHVWSDFDNDMINFFTITPGEDNNTFLSNNSFIDMNATTAEVDFVNKKIKGKFVDSNEIGQVTINSLVEWQSGDYDENYISISDVSRAYGYGYGGGQEIDYFNVIQTEIENSFSGQKVFTGFTGSEIGFGVSDTEGNVDFETLFPNSYAYGYGWEYASGFPQTLSSTVVTLKPLAASLVVFDESVDDYVINNVSEQTLFYPSSRAKDSTPTPIKDFIFQASLRSSPVRSSSINNTSSDDIFSFICGKNARTDDGVNYVESDISCLYTNWETGYDASIDNYVFFSLKQKEKDGSTKYSDDFDPDWTFDHSIDLYIEFTYEGIRYFYQYKNNQGPEYKIFNRATKYFTTDLYRPSVNDQNPSEVILSAEVYKKDNISTPFINLVLVGSYKIPTGIIDYEKTPEENGLPTPAASILIKNITGLYLIASNGARDGQTDDQYKSLRQFGPIVLPQGLRTDLDPEVVDDLPEGKMPVSIDRIFMSGTFGFSSDIDRNKVSNLSITFPDPVDFTSISWVSEEPSDSIVYLQIEKVDDGNGYLRSPIYTNKTSELLSKEIVGFPTEEIQYRVSGSDFPEQFRNTDRIRVQVVLLPSSDSLVAPMISSITFNYNSQTSGGQFVTTTADQWTNARKQQNLLVTNDGKVKLLDISRTQNLIYGTEGKLVEYESASGSSSWSVFKLAYTGSDLPQTVSQLQNGISPRISGKVTDIKILEDGKIAFLDRDSSRVCIVKYEQSIGNYIIDTILCSEYSWNNTDDDFNKPEYAKKAKFLKAIYNADLGENGVLYCVFSHDLSCWYSGVIDKKNVTDNSWTINSEEFKIRKQGIANNLSGSKKIFVADRNVIGFELDGVTANLILSSSNPKIDITFNPQKTTNSTVSGDNTAIKFTSENQIDSVSRTEVSIEKIGKKLTNGTKKYNQIFMPIQGIVAFDIDSYDNIYLLKNNRPYTWDTEANGFDTSKEHYYCKSKIDSYWQEWSETENQLVDDELKTKEPYYFTSNIFGNKASIEFRDPFLLICFSGDKEIYLFRKESGLYSSPQIISIPNDGTYPMSAHFDTKTFVSGSEPDFGAIYVALSDLTYSGGKNSKSRVIKISNDGQEVVWEWGKTNEEINTGGFANVVNDVRPILFSDKDQVIVSV